MKNNSRIIKRLVINQFDKIYKISKSVSKSYYGADVIHVDALNVVIQKAKLQTGTDLPSNFITAFNLTLDQLYNVCSENATKTGIVYSAFLSGCISTIKKSFIQGLS